MPGVPYTLDDDFDSDENKEGESPDLRRWGHAHVCQLCLRFAPTVNPDAVVAAWILFQDVPETCSSTVPEEGPVQSLV